MGVMERTLYLQSEDLNFRNYPELQGILNDIQELIGYSTAVSNALNAYVNTITTRINLSIVDLQKYASLCRNLCNTIGNAPNVCYDLLVEMRLIQDTLQTLIYIKNCYGSQYIGVEDTP